MDCKKLFLNSILISNDFVIYEKINWFKAITKEIREIDLNDNKNESNGESDRLDARTYLKFEFI